MDESIKKMLRKLKSDCMDGRLYIFAQHRVTRDTYRFSFSLLNIKSANLLANRLRRRNFTTAFWRTANGQSA